MDTDEWVVTLEPYTPDNETMRKEVTRRKLPTQRRMVIVGASSSQGQVQLLLSPPVAVADKLTNSLQVLILVATIQNSDLLATAVNAALQSFVDFYNPADILFPFDVVDNSILLTFEVSDCVDKEAREWINPNYTFYTYKITASDSNKYYYGVSHVKIPNATEKDCLEDGYWGSGGVKIKGNKFVNWKRKHDATLVKKIIGIYPRMSTAYLAEAELVGDKWRTDPLCLNSLKGGHQTGVLKKGSTTRFSVKPCPIHGETKHNGNACCQCTAEANVALRTCPVHGETKHIGEQCYKCSNNKSVTTRICPIHGETKHIGDQCCKCRKSNCTEGVCPVHGTTTFTGNMCRKCLDNKPRKQKVCDLCGELFTPTGGRQRICTAEHLVECKGCGTMFPYARRKSYCSPACGAAHATSKPAPRSCDICGKVFQPSTSNQRFCQSPHPFTCPVCDNTYLSNPSMPHSTCSIACREAVTPRNRNQFGQFT